MPQQGSLGELGQVGIFIAILGAFAGWGLVAGLRAAGLMEADPAFDLLELVPGLVEVVLSEGEEGPPVVSYFVGLCFGVTVVAFTVVVMVAAVYERIPGLRSRRNLEDGILMAGWAAVPVVLVLLGAASDQWRSAIIGLGVVLFVVFSAWFVLVVAIVVGKSHLEPWLARFR